MPTGPVHDFSERVAYRRFGSVRAPVVPGRSFIEGRTSPTFPAAPNIDPRRLRFRGQHGLSSTAIEISCAADVADLLARGRSLAVLLGPSMRDDAPFWCGRTLIERDGAVYAYQLVVFPRVSAERLYDCVDGAICRVPLGDLAAWSGASVTDGTRRAS